MSTTVKEASPSETRGATARRKRVTIQRVSTTEAIANELTRSILDGTYSAGTYLREVDLSEQYGVSRQSLRAALASVAHQGLLRHEAHRGVRVPVISRRDLQDIYYMRMLLETEAIRHLCLHPEVWPPIDRAVAVLEALPNDTRWADLVEADLAIHRQIINAVGSPRLRRAYAMIDAESRLAIVPGQHHQTKPMIAREHRALLDVVKLGDPEASIARFREHLWFGTEEILARLPEDAG